MDASITRILNLQIYSTTSAEPPQQQQQQQQQQQHPPPPELDVGCTFVETPKP